MKTEITPKCKNNLHQLLMTDESHKIWILKTKVFIL